MPSYRETELIWDDVLLAGHRTRLEKAQNASCLTIHCNPTGNISNAIEVFFFSGLRPTDDDSAAKSDIG